MKDTVKIKIQTTDWEKQITYVTNNLYSANIKKKTFKIQQ